MINVGIVGFSNMGRIHAQCYGANPKARVAAVTDLQPLRREEAESSLGCRAFADLGEMLASPDIDVIDICTPTFLHEEQFIMAARAGKHILCEKPMSLSVESCGRMIEAAEVSGIRAMVAHVIRFWPEYRIIKDIIASNLYGRVQWISASRLSAAPDWTWGGWMVDPEKSGGAVLDLHIHDIDFISWLIGLPSEIQSRGHFDLHTGVNSVMTLGWNRESGVSSYAEASQGLSPGFPFGMSLVVACDGATIKYDINSRPTLTVYPADAEPYSPELSPSPLNTAPDAIGNVDSLKGYYAETEYFIGCVEADRAPEIVTLREARNAVMVCLAAKESVITGHPIPVTGEISGGFEKVCTGQD